MKKAFLILLSAGMIISCNSHKKSSKGRNGSRYNSESAAASASSSENITYITNSDSIGRKAADSADINYESNGATRVYTNFGGAVGIGTGGSYASHAYRHELMNKKNKRREYFKKRMKDFDKDYYGEEEVKALPAMLQDSSSVSQDSLTVDNFTTDSSAFATDEW